MSIYRKKNGLELKEIGSKIIPLNQTPDSHKIESGALQGIIDTHFVGQSAWFVTWLDHALRIGWWDGSAFHCDKPFTVAGEEASIQQLRLFNKIQELFVRRSSAGLQGRLRQDDEQGKGQDVVIAHQILFGTKKGSMANEHFTEITEDRGASLILPFTESQLGFYKLNSEEWLHRRICIKTHTYITPTGQASYIDSRFVCFSDGQNELTHERRGA